MGSLGLISIEGCWVSSVKLHEQRPLVFEMQLLSHAAAYEYWRAVSLPTILKAGIQIFSALGISKTKLSSWFFSQAIRIRVSFIVFFFPFLL